MNSNGSDILKIELKWAHRILIGYKQGLACFSLVVVHPRQFLSSVIYWCDAPGVLMCAPWTFWRTKPRFWVDTEWIRIEHSSKCLYHQNSSKWANDATVILIENNAPIYIKTYNITHSSYLFNITFSNEISTRANMNLTAFQKTLYFDDSGKNEHYSIKLAQKTPLKF